MSNEFTFGDNSDELSIFRFFKKKKLVDRDLTEYQITQTLTLSRLHAHLEQTRGIRLFTHTQRIDCSRQGKFECWHTPSVDIPVPQIVEEIAETRNPLIKCNSNLNVHFDEIEVFPT